VEIPPRYRGPTNGVSALDVEGDTVRACIDAVEARYPGFSELIFDVDGEIRRYARLFLNGDAIAQGGADVPIANTDTVQILASAAGG
jgi:molybdopterin converting factor small subunit